MSEPGGGTDNTPYRVLARKYRPERFADLIGQEALVRTLTNAIQQGRVAQAFIFTGVRGVGKTTTARIVARALNCTGSEDAGGDAGAAPGESPGEGGPRAEPCGVCDNCRAIAEDRHVDVMEMDAASRTGIDDIREIIESVRYRPVQARRKVYIIDEVHMLSRQAFNGLLKTLEEPPEHVVFIFATTEIRKVPVTVLSRCQRFDLRRVPQDRLQSHFAAICEKEAVGAEEDALALIARAADGSVRDGLSLLDQAIALGSGQVVADQVQAMLGLADRGRILDLLDFLLAGNLAAALALSDELYAAGADPAVMLQDLLELTHEVSRVKVVPATLESLPVGWREPISKMAERLGVPDLTRCWQILLKGLGETQRAPRPREAAEMVMIRLGHASRLPTPGDLVRRLEGETKAGVSKVGVSKVGGDSKASPQDSRSAQDSMRPEGAPQGAGGGALALVEPVAAPPPEPAPPETATPVSQTASAADPQDLAPQDLAGVEALARAVGEMRLANHLRRDLHLVRLEPGRLEFRPGDQAPAQLAGQISRLLDEATGRRWMVSVSRDQGMATLHEQDQAEEAEKRAAALQHPLVRATLETFPKATLVERRDKTAPPVSGTRDVDEDPPQ